MRRNLKPASAHNAVLPASITGFEDEIFHRINTELLDGGVTLPDPMFDILRAILETRARQAQTETANNAESDLLADMSHEIRTPMGAIIGLSRILMETKLDDKQKRCVVALQGSAEALLTMVNRTLSARKIESRTDDPESGPFDMAALLDQIAGIMSIKAQEKNIDLTLYYAAGAPKTFVGDCGYIRQIVMNLVGNAIKFTEAGGVTVSFAARESEVSISVADTGIGIAADKIGAIFGRFGQADSSIGRKYGGSGLGLSISKALAENMGGTITVRSVPGKGSTFILNLRLPAEAGAGGTERHYEDNVIYLDALANAVTGAGSIPNWV